MAVLQDVSKANGKDKDTADLMAQLEALKAENQRLKEARTSRISFKVSEKGAVSVYGLGRFPVTLYRSQWDRLIQAMPGLKAFIEAHSDQLTSKDD